MSATKTLSSKYKILYLNKEIVLSEINKNKVCVYYQAKKESRSSIKIEISNNIDKSKDTETLLKSDIVYYDTDMIVVKDETAEEKELIAGGSIGVSIDIKEEELRPYVVMLNQYIVNPSRPEVSIEKYIVCRNTINDNLYVPEETVKRMTVDKLIYYLRSVYDPKFLHLQAISLNNEVVDDIFIDGGNIVFFGTKGMLLKKEVILDRQLAAWNVFDYSGEMLERVM
jgi:hypothetical protein